MQTPRLADLDFAGKRVTVVGLGIEGVDLVRYLSRHGAEITISDSKTAEQLSERLKDIAGLSVHLSLASDREVAGADSVFVSQGVPLDLPDLVRLRERGVPLFSMTGLFLDLCPGPIVGITGSSGKTTTTALVGEMFEADERPVFVGGNIGIGLLDHLPSVRPYTWSILEVSHTQLQIVSRSPHVAAILNITPNHLDRFSWDDYRGLKASIIRHQTTDDIALLNHDDAECRSLDSEVLGRLLWFSLDEDIPGDGVFLRDGHAVLRLGRLAESLFDASRLRLRGRHNLANAVAAAAISAACGISLDAIACAVERFRGVPHRLEPVATVNGVQYVNDSIATTPERTLAGLRAFAEPVVLLLGGRDKHLPLDELVLEALKRCRAVVLFGESADKLEIALKAAAGGSSALIRRAADLPEAIAVAADAARGEDVVLLSPACTSYDAYENFERRGEHFRSLVLQLVQEVQPSLP